MPLPSSFHRPVEPKRSSRASFNSSWRHSTQAYRNSNDTWPDMTTPARPQPPGQASISCQNVPQTSNQSTSQPGKNPGSAHSPSHPANAPILSHNASRPGNVQPPNPSPQPAYTYIKRAFKRIKAICRGITWSKVVASAITIVLSGIAIPFAIESWRMSKWTQYKDFVEVCAALDAKGKSNSKCLAVLANPIPIPSNNPFFRNVTSRSIVFPRNIDPGVDGQFFLPNTIAQPAAIIVLVCMNLFLLITWILPHGQTNKRRISDDLNSVSQKSHEKNTSDAEKNFAQASGISTITRDALMFDDERKIRRRRYPPLSTLDKLRGAISGYRLDELRQALENGADPNMGFHHDELLATAAYKSPNLEALKILLDFGGRIPFWTFNVERRVLSPFIESLFYVKPSPEIYMVILQHLDTQLGIREIEDTPYFTDSSGETSQKFTFLGYSAKAITPGICEYLIERGASMSRLNEDGETPIMRMILNDNIPSAALLVSYGSDVNVYSKDGLTALQVAVNRRYKELSQVLLERGADPNLILRGMEPLTSATLAGNFELCELLVLHNAHINSKISKTLQPIFIAALKADHAIFKLFENHRADLTGIIDHNVNLLHAILATERDESQWEPICRNIIRAGVSMETDCRSSGFCYGTPLHAAAKNGLQSCCTLLLDEGANVNCGDEDGYSPLMAAAVGGRLSVLLLLLDRGANVNFQSSKGNTVLHLILQERLGDMKAIARWEMALACIQHGCDIGSRNKSGLTALDEQSYRDDRRNRYIFMYQDGELTIRTMR